MAHLEQRDWLDHALAVLAEAGHGALKAQSLAKGLGVTRGSFYWHFDSLEVFHHALIGHWSEQTTERLIAAVEQAGPPDERLRQLMHQALRSGERLERAIRAWATVDAHVAGLVNSVDLRRIAYAEGLLLAVGISGDHAPGRARMMYWASIGRLMMPIRTAHVLSDAEVDALVAMLIAPG